MIDFICLHKITSIIQMNVSLLVGFEKKQQSCEKDTLKWQGNEKIFIRETPKYKGKLVILKQQIN